MRYRHFFAASAWLLALTSAHAEMSLESFVDKEILSGRYMSPPGGCAASEKDVFNWPKAELQRCRYTVTDVFANGTKREKKAFVYLANPAPERVLAWLKTACAIVQPNKIDPCVRRFVVAIRNASGAQFPVAGLVWEDQLCGDPQGKCKFDKEGNPSGDGIQEGYIFRNGVTVRVNGFSNGSTAPVLTDEAIEALATAQEVTGVKGTGGFARVISTAREHFRDHTGRKDIPVGKSDAPSAIAWSDIVGATYRTALSNDANPLITATICASFQFPKGCKPK